jgi:hypothetical protein
MHTPTPILLSSDDWCHRLAFYSERYEAPFLSPKEILWRAIEHGLLSPDADYAQAANDYAMELCTSTTIDTNETDLLGLAEHIAGLAEIAVWVARTAGAWVRPEPKRIGDGALWSSGAFLSQRETKLRHLVCVERWDAMREMELRTSWQIAGECAVYQAPMDVIILVIGAMRNGRWSSPFTTGWRHPVAKDLRFRRRDGESFGATWLKVWREQDKCPRDEWLDAMTDDAVLGECVHALTIDVPDRAENTVRLSVEKVERLTAQTETPEPQPSRCFDRMRPCAFRGCCPQGKTPDEMGFRSKFIPSP